MIHTLAKRNIRADADAAVFHRTVPISVLFVIFSRINTALKLAF